MIRTKTMLRRFAADQSGASAVEFSIVVTVFIVASMGVVELGRAYQVRNELAYAADIGGRRLSVMVNNPTINPSNYAAEIKNEITATFQGYDADKLSVAVTAESLDGVTFQKLTLKYPMNVFIPFRSDTYDLKIVRRVVQL
jgi:Flp pilus assembly protein TadG